ncbi:unnamed protein product [Periconia digitata]|uniref:non-specific serine/threonine protein kinase n=1 Tax=Periconia digitata TaxID=1303443 RepID=A0A9W4XGQ8_9PLEO|nr:unnamed protein product [Periconia digitata]
MQTNPEPATLPGGYRIIRDLGKQGGFFNKGIHLVENIHEDPPRLMICKTVESGTPYREVPILFRLRGFSFINQIVDFVPCATDTDFSSMAKQEMQHHSVGSLNKPAYQMFGVPRSLTDSAQPYVQEVSPSNKTDHIYLEYADLGSLAELTERHRAKGVRIPESFLWHVFLSIAKALKACHTGLGRQGWRAIRHGDVDLGNILLASPVDEDMLYPKVMLADFGCAVEAGWLLGGEHLFDLSDDVASLGRTMRTAADSLPTRKVLIERNPHMRTMSQEQCTRVWRKMYEDDLKGYSAEFSKLLDACNRKNPQTGLPDCLTSTELVNMIEALHNKMRIAEALDGRTMFHEHGGELMF